LLQRIARVHHHSEFHFIKLNPFYSFWCDGNAGQLHLYTQKSQAEKATYSLLDLWGFTKKLCLQSTLPKEIQGLATHHQVARASSALFQNLERSPLEGAFNSSPLSNYQTLRAVRPGASDITLFYTITANVGLNQRMLGAEITDSEHEVVSSINTSWYAEKDHWEEAVESQDMWKLGWTNLLEKCGAILFKIMANVFTHSLNWILSDFEHLYLISCESCGKNEAFVGKFHQPHAIVPPDFSHPERSPNIPNHKNPTRFAFSPRFWWWPSDYKGSCRPDSVVVQCPSVKGSARHVQVKCVDSLDIPRLRSL